MQKVSIFHPTLHRISHGLIIIKTYEVSFRIHGQKLGKPTLDVFNIGFPTLKKKESNLQKKDCIDNMFFCFTSKHTSKGHRLVV